MSDPNTPQPTDDSGAGENTPPEENSATPEPSASEPSASEPTPSEPSASESTPSEPSDSEPTPSEPSDSEPTPSEPVAAASEPVSPESEPPVGGVGLGQGTLSEPDEKTMGLLSHILGGVTSFVGPLIIWLIKKDESPFVDDQGKEALNFQITVLIGYVAAGIVAFLPVIGCLSAILYPAIGIFSLVFAILGGIEANKGVAYRYPFAARFVN